MSWALSARTTALCVLCDSPHTITPIALRYRGVSMHTHLRSELRLECVASDGQSPPVVHSLRALAGVNGQVAVLDLEQLHQDCADERVYQAESRLGVAV